MNDIEWGEPISGEIVQAMGLADDTPVRIGLANVGDPTGEWEVASFWTFDSDSGYRLPATHPYYLAQSRGFTYWPGGDSAPADWDGGEVLFRNGELGRAEFDSWDRDDVGYDAIGYRKRTEQPAPAIAPELVERAFSLLREIAKDGKEAKFEGHGVYFAARKILDALNPIDPDLTLAKSIMGDAEAIALAIKAARENGRG